MKFSWGCLTLLVSSLSFNLQTVAQTASREPDSLGSFYLKNIDTWSIHAATIGEDYTYF